MSVGTGLTLLKILRCVKRPVLDGGSGTTVAQISASYHHLFSRNPTKAPFSPPSGINQPSQGERGDAAQIIFFLRWMLNRLAERNKILHFLRGIFINRSTIAWWIRWRARGNFFILMFSVISLKKKTRNNRGFLTRFFFAIWLLSFLFFGPLTFYFLLFTFWLLSILTFYILTFILFDFPHFIICFWLLSILNFSRFTFLLWLFAV